MDQSSTARSTVWFGTENKKAWTANARHFYTAQPLCTALTVVCFRSSRRAARYESQRQQQRAYSSCGCAMAFFTSVRVRCGQHSQDHWYTSMREKDIGVGESESDARARGRIAHASHHQRARAAKLHACETKRTGRILLSFLCFDIEAWLVLPVNLFF